MINPLLRWWRSRGHGIHSPYAYRLVTSVLPERGRYHAYDEIEKMSDPSRLKLLFRLVCEFKPATVLDMMIDDEEKEVILMADPRITFVDQPGDADLIVGSLPFVLREGQAVIHWSTGSAWRTFKSLLTGGMTFSNGRYGIAVNRPGLPRQNFETKF